jgi:outer membrane receptor protein involved in Fe transport
MLSALRPKLMSKQAIWLLALLLVWTPPESAAQAPPRQVQPADPEDPPVDDGVDVISASKRQERLVNAPVTMSVISEEVIGNAPAQSLTDLLRLVPGVNSVRTSARDVNITTRSATGTLSDSTLVLLDGRSVYQDFFGFVLWDFLPVDTTEIKQVEVIRGPASAVWGANAMTGVVNVITKTPMEMAEEAGRKESTNVSIRFGQFDRSRTGERFEGGGLFSINATHASAVSDRFAYKVSAGVMTQEPLLRPIGNVPGTSTPYPSFENRGTTQPRLDARVDYDTPAKKETLVLAAGMSGTEGIIHTGLGPLDIQRGSTLKYGRLTYTRDRTKLQIFVNALDAESPVLLLSGLDGQALALTFENQAYDVELSDSRVHDRHILSYGGNYRHNSFNISMAPRGDSRDEGGAYVQEEIFLSQRARWAVRWVVGTRVDVFDVLDKAVLSPRTALLLKPRPGQTIRFSFNRAFRAPSFINSYLDTAFLTRVDLAAGGQISFPSVATGNLDLKEEDITAYEVGYIGEFKRMTLGAAVYVNRMRNMIQFTQIASFTSDTPSRFTYRNFESIRDRGLELSIERSLTKTVSAFANYSWQDDPKPTGFDIAELNLQPAQRFNAGVGFTGVRYFGNLSGSFVDRAFWQDVDPRYVGFTDAYSTIDGGFGVRSTDGTMTVAVRGKNLFNKTLREHVFGDLIKRAVTGEVIFRF